VFSARQLSWKEMNIESPLQQTREGWLNYVAQRMGPMFERLGAPLPAQLRIAIGFTSSGRRSRHIGECWDNQCSEDRHFEIFIRPDLSESKDLMPMQVAAILAHELVHAAIGVTAGHRKEFRRVARGIGLVGQMAATTAGPEFEEALWPVLKEAGPLPHGRLSSTSGASSHSSRRKRQHPSRVECVCNTCGYAAHTTRRWFDLAGAPLCPKHGQMDVQKI
jgi:hypothetical protein